MNQLKLKKFGFNDLMNINQNLINLLTLGDDQGLSRKNSFSASHSSILSSPSICPCCGQPTNSRNYGEEIWNKNAKKH